LSTSHFGFKHSNLRFNRCWVRHLALFGLIFFACLFAIAIAIAIAVLIVSDYCFVVISSFAVLLPLASVIIVMNDCFFVWTKRRRKCGVRLSKIKRARTFSARRYQILEGPVISRLYRILGFHDFMFVFFLHSIYF
jgi:hypothetical protein